MEDMAENRRAHPRFLYRQAVQIRTAESECIGETRDLSNGGLFVAIEGLVVTPGQTLRISLRFDGEGVRGDYRAKVAHVMRGATGEPAGIGLELVDTTPESRLAWVRHMHWIQENGAVEDTW